MAPDMYHVDRKSLYTSLEARIDYLHKFLDWDDRESFTSKLTVSWGRH